MSSAWIYAEAFDVLNSVNSKASNEIASHCEHFQGHRVTKQLKTGANLANVTGLAPGVPELANLTGLAPGVPEETLKKYSKIASTGDTHRMSRRNRRGTFPSRPHAEDFYMKHCGETRTKSAIS